MDKFYSTDELSELLNIPKRTIQYWIRQGDLVAIKLGKEYRIAESDLQAFLENRKTNKKG